MDRITGKHVARTFELFVKALGGHIAKDYKDVGGYVLDRNTVYGGYVVGQICNEHGAQTNPFGDGRMLAREMYQTLWFAIRAIEVATKLNTVA